MEEKSAGIQRSRRVRYDGGWETVYWLDPQGALGLPLGVWRQTDMVPGASWLALFPFRRTLFLVDRGLV